MCSATTYGPSSLRSGPPSRRQASAHCDKSAVSDRDADAISYGDADSDTCADADPNFRAYACAKRDPTLTPTLGPSETGTDPHASPTPTKSSDPQRFAARTPAARPPDAHRASPGDGWQALSQR